MSEKRNIFGHPSVAKPIDRGVNMPSNDRLAQMADMLREDPDAELESVQDNQNMTLGDLEQLVFLGCVEDSKVINGFKFDLRTLTGKEQNDVWLSVAFLGNETKFFVVKIAFLSRAITAVNGRKLDMLYKGKDFRELTTEQRCTRVVETWQDTLINELYNFYSDLVERSRKAIRPEDVKK